jgi:hypothetical protein
MANLTLAERRAFPYSDHMPADVLQRLSRAELCDRLVYSRERGRVAKRTATPGHQRVIMQEIIAMMRAQPRSSTEREVATKMKAAAVPDQFQGAAIRRSAQELLDKHPPAPRNPDAELIVKAAAGEDGLMAIFDENGCIVGVCPQDALVPVLLPSQISKARATGRAPQAGKLAAVRVAKAPPAKAASPVEVFDEAGRSVGFVQPGDLSPASADSQARNTGPVMAGGTTGLGQPRGTGSAAALPGDVPGRQVIKSRRR